MIHLAAFRELWIHTGTACNLSCPFCHEGSKPGDTRLEALTLADIAPLLDAAAARGVERFAVTGGEPLILKDIHAILMRALQLRPVLVLTNGTAPFIRRSHQLASLRTAPHALSFRVSIDFPDETQHDAGRGLKNFRKAMEGLRLLHAAGFAVGIMRQQRPGEDTRAIQNRFRNLLRKQHLPEDLPVAALPELGALHAPVDTSPEQLSTHPAPCETACSRSRMLLRRDGALRIAPCPLVDDDASMEWSATDPASPLDVALRTAVEPRHTRCQICLTQGVNYIGLAAAEGV